VSAREELVASYYTLTGAPVGQPPRFSFEDRVAAAAAAGFSGIGLLSEDYAALRAAGHRDADLQRVLDDHGLRIAEVEFLFGWATEDPASGELEATLLAMVDAFSPHHLTCGELGPPGSGPSLDLTIERFAGLCDRAAEHDTRVALEFLPWSAVPDLRTAWTIVEGAGRSNGGVLVDAWHYYRGRPDDGLLRSLPPSAVAGVQLDDADELPEGSAMEDTILRRRLPGAGSFALEDLVRTLDLIGVDVPYSVEIMSTEEQARPVAEAATRAHDASAAVLRRARHAPSPPVGRR